ncbi:3-hydroxyisobutyrate dehydrogenase or related beta-hydroxyacid dehydrogenase [Mycobacterium rhizamassiliense]|uniref:3-hydroxyisobutyrate dehydrogenase or related beta-hydroxyacid dehydrogenase n=2 Tax=Mycobacterium TaxID=1763 RepID=A0A2U3PB62_9MYCO|nr:MULTISPECIES: NAD(P)-dependent oxidoreductase [Mycobacterium]SPM35178.1 3-hydroxyisobutyrate dehydrogenase or related beta-hydroxyacid dehydrogenase [Mycobacterium rhizamassiliense]SPM41007.1 3-hydroxyisobutyrate dehydrogenase or related beta-hydroxyacid dehydrogenase [Mycobacterium numidiamassiliense]
MTAAKPIVGFIGLGSQGAPMAQALIDAGHDTVLWARRPEALEPFADTARVASNPAELAELADVVGICVLNDDDVVEVALRPNGLLAGITPGTTVLIHSTVHPTTCRQLGDRFSERRAHVLDAPVSGGGEAARARRLLVMVGGDHEIYTAVAPVLSAFGDPVVHVGALGSGQLAKLLNNLLFTATLGLAHETAELAAELGVDATALMSILQHASGRSFAVQMYAGLLGGLRPPSARVRTIAGLLGKDVAIARDLAENANAGDHLLTVAHRMLAAMGHDLCV